MTSSSAFEFKQQIYSRLSELVEEKLEERKKHIAAIYFSEKIDDQEEDLQILKQGDAVQDALDKQKADIETSAKRVGGMKGANSRLISGTRKIIGNINKGHGPGNKDRLAKKFAGMDMKKYVRRMAGQDGAKTRAANAKKKNSSSVVVKEDFRVASFLEYLTEASSARSNRRKRNTQKMGRLKIVRVRIRGGKVQRRKKLSATKGYTLRKGRLARILPAERRKRRLGARRAKFKRKAKLNRIRVKLKRSLRRRRSLGL